MKAMEVKRTATTVALKKEHHSRTSTQLPPDWNKHNDDQGQRYYSNSNTQETTWVAPEGSTGGSASVSVPAKKD